MAFKMKGYTPFTKNDDDDKNTIVIKYDDEGNMIPNEEELNKVIKEEKNEEIESWINNPKSKEKPNWEKDVESERIK